MPWWQLQPCRRAAKVLWNCDADQPIPLPALAAERVHPSGHRADPPGAHTRSTGRWEIAVRPSIRLGRVETPQDQFVEFPFYATEQPIFVWSAASGLTRASNQSVDMVVQSVDKRQKARLTQLWGAIVTPKRAGNSLARYKGFRQIGARWNGTQSTAKWRFRMKTRNRARP